MRLVLRPRLAHFAPMILAATCALGCQGSDDAASYDGDDAIVDAPDAAPRPFKLRRDGRILEGDQLPVTGTPDDEPTLGGPGEEQAMPTVDVGIAAGETGSIALSLGVPPLNDTCSGATTVSLDIGTGAPSSDTQVRVGTTLEAIDDYRSFCGDTTVEADSPDVAYTLVLQQAGVLDLSVTGTGFAPILHIDRTACGESYALDHCLSLSSTQHFTQWFEAGTYSIIVDGDGSTVGGDFTLTAKLSTGACGDLVVAPNEACDDGNSATGDGCDSCFLETGSGTNDACDGDLVNLRTDAIQMVAGHTMGYVDDYQGSCVYEGGAPDRVWRVRPASDGTMVVSVGNDAGSNPYCADENHPQCWDRALYVRSAGNCSSSEIGDELACSDGMDWSDTEQVTIQVTANTDYFVILDGYGDFPWSAGAYSVFMELLP
jgi:cysteine-rich repeat protein